MPLLFMHNFAHDYDDIVFPPDPLTRLARLEERVKHLEAALSSLQRVSDRVQLDDASGKWYTVTESKLYGPE